MFAITSVTDVRTTPFFMAAAAASLALVVLAPLAAASPGDLFEADFGSGIIYKFDPSGVRKVFASGLHDPEGMTYDANGNFYVSETGTGVINKFTPDGTRNTFASGLNGERRPCGGMRIGHDQQLELIESFHRFGDARDAVAGMPLNEHRPHSILLIDLILWQRTASNQRVSGMPGASIDFLESKRESR